MTENSTLDTCIAIIGADIRAPGARSLDEFMGHILEGTEALQDVSGSDEKLPDAITRRPVLADVDQFEPSYFGMSMAEAIKLDPQHRHFLMLCRSLLHKAAVDPKKMPNIGVIASCDENQYQRNILAPSLAAGSAAAFSNYVSSEKDFVATRVSYLLGLTGPAYTVQTACSSSLVAVHQAILSLRAGECDACIAGGVSIQFPHGQTVQHIPGMIYSKDGSCRPFDAQADGTNLGSGAAAVLLCRYEDAIARGDKILATIQGSAINNDGNRKMSYTAPSPTGQQRAIEKALKVAGDQVDNIAFVETHGTATRLGDPIEFRSLHKAFSALGAKAERCALTGLKANFGHLSCAAGVAGVIKAAMCLDARVIPQMTNFEAPSPLLRLSGSAFRILRENEVMGAGPQRALVSSFGIGGTNAVVVLESHENQTQRGLDQGSTQPRFTLLSDEKVSNLAWNVARVAAQQERAEDASQPFGWVGSRLSETGSYRGFVLASATGELSHAVSDTPVAGQPNLCVVFPGQGAFPTELVQQLYATENGFRRHFDTVVDAFEQEWQRQLITEINSNDKTILPSQSLQFACQVALFNLLADLGIHASHAVGHSLGEFAAMVSCKLITMENAARLVAIRDEAMRKAPPGRMLVLKGAPIEFIVIALAGGCSIAAINGGGQITLSGSIEQIEALQAELRAKDAAEVDFGFRVLDTKLGFHREDMRSCLTPLEQGAQGLQLDAGSPHFISTVTGKPIDTTHELSSYLVAQAVQPVLFSSAIETALQTGATHFVEIGRSFISGWVTQKGAGVIPLLDFGSGDAQFSLYSGLGKLWAAGMPIVLPGTQVLDGHHKAFLPEYEFETETCWPSPAMPDSVLAYANAAEPVHETASAQQQSHVKKLAGGAVWDALTQLFTRHLNVVELSADADFIKLGVHSMMAINLCADIKKETGVPIEMVKFMELGTPRRLEEWLLEMEDA